MSTSNTAGSVQQEYFYKLWSLVPVFQGLMMKLFHWLFWIYSFWWFILMINFNIYWQHRQPCCQYPTETHTYTQSKTKGLAKKSSFPTGQHVLISCCYQRWHYNQLISNLEQSGCCYLPEMLPSGTSMNLQQHTNSCLETTLIRGDVFPVRPVWWESCLLESNPGYAGFTYY